MKKVCFVVSHLGSGSGSLVSALNTHPQCQIHESGMRYDSPAALKWLFRAGHKCGDASAVYGDHLLFNASISSRAMYGAGRLIFVVRPARSSLEGILSHGYDPEGASAYYRFRLRRMCEIARRSPGSLLLSWDDLARESTYAIIQQHLGLRSPLRPAAVQECVANRFPERLVAQCEDAYERYYYYLVGLDLRRPIDKVA